MYQSKYPMILGGTLSPGPELPSAFNAKNIGIHGILIGLSEMIGMVWYGMVW